MIKKYILLLLIVLSFIEFSFYISSKFTDSKKLTYKKTKLLNETEYTQYLEQTSDLGWPSNIKIKRLKEKNKDSCIDVYGDSFIYGLFDNLTEKDIWSHHLTKSLGCKVGNFGISGYGNDQAFLHLKKNIEKYKNNNTTVLYAVTSINIKRNLNRFRGLINGNEYPAGKPRYIAENNKLKLIKKYDLSYKSYKELYLKRGKGCPAHEDICELHSYINQISTFPYSISIPFSLMRSKKIQVFLKGYSLHQYLYESDYLNALTIVSLLVKEFDQLLKTRTINRKVLLIPTLSDIKFALKNDRNQFNNLIDFMRINKLPFIDFSKEIVNSIKKGNSRPEDYFLRSGHFSKKGHWLLSNFITKNI
jgi:hypothetical protein